MRRPKLGLAIGLGLSATGYRALVVWSRQALVGAPSSAELEASLRDRLATAGLAEVESRYQDTPAGRVHVLLAGRSGSPVALLPGLAASAGDFAELIVALARDHRVIAIDLPGSGLSDPVGFKGHPRRPWIEVIQAVVDREQIDQFSLVGHSLGGLAAGGFAIAHPERVRRLVLLSPLGLSRRIPRLWNLTLVPGLMDLRGLYQRATLTRGSGGHRLAGDHRRPDRGARAQGLYRLGVGRRFGAGSDLGLVPRLLRPFRLRADSQLLPGLGLLADRVLVIWGGDDRRLSWRDAEVELAYFPRLRATVVPNTGHLFPVLQPVPTAGLIAEFLRPGCA
ncbi:MAG TPA: alpha/beta hydrolase [Candidatus Dormibacteraeota bacterium]|nr:alpha/beta hydrolase [Candidatus Dormibacteraeota bacterium]